jgi:hypothetical protein
VESFTNILREQLASGEIPEGEHLSGDLLAAFSERSLPQSERGCVLSHLATCSQCREALSLGMPELIPDVSPVSSRRPKALIWKFPASIRWGSAAAAVLVAIGVGVLVEQHNLMHRDQAVTVLQATSPNAPAAQQESHAASQEPFIPLAKKSETRTKHAIKALPSSAPQAPEAIFAGAAIASPSSRADAEMSQRNGVLAGAVTVENGPPALQSADRTVEASAAAPAMQNSEVQPKLQSAHGLSAVPSVAKSHSADIARWAVSSSGQLLRNAVSGEWVNIQPAPGVAFRAVAAQGIEVWAGGAEGNSDDALSSGRGVLFHSSDAGETWKQAEGPWRQVVSRVALNGPGVVTVTADDGNWKSSDGGQSWTAVQ